MIVILYLNALLQSLAETGTKMVLKSLLSKIILILKDELIYDEHTTLKSNSAQNRISQLVY